MSDKGRAVTATRRGMAYGVNGWDLTGLPWAYSGIQWSYSGLARGLTAGSEYGVPTPRETGCNH